MISNRQSKLVRQKCGGIANQKYQHPQGTDNESVTVIKIGLFPGTAGFYLDFSF
jgi:hypothetical protein